MRTTSGPRAFAALATAFSILPWWTNTLGTLTIISLSRVLPTPVNGEMAISPAALGEMAAYLTTRQPLLRRPFRQQMLLHFAQSRARQLVNLQERARHFERRQVRAASRFQRARVERAIGDDVGDGHFWDQMFGPARNSGCGIAAAFRLE